MALKSTIYKVELSLSDQERNLYQDFQLTVARHPSENDLRMLYRLFAFALFADSELTFTKGLCCDDEPELWVRSYEGKVLHWIELGLPDPKRLKKYSKLSEQISVVTYQGDTAVKWYEQNQKTLSDLNNLSVIHISPESEKDLLAMVDRSMRLAVTIQEGTMWVSSNEFNCSISYSFAQKSIDGYI